MRWSAYRRKSLLPDIEIITIVLLTTLIFMCYGMVAEICARIGVNYASYLVTSLDINIPFTNVWGLFYEVAFYVPAIVLLLLRLRFGANIALFQRICLSVVVMMLLSFVVFLFIPTNSSLILGVPHIQADSFGNAVALFIYRSIEGWNSTPSTHIAMSWLFFRFFARYFCLLWQRCIYLLWFAAMTIGTLTLRVHIIVDICTGLLLAEFCYQCVYKKISTRTMAEINRHFSIKQEIMFFGILATVLAALLFWFVHTYGIHPILTAG